MKRHRLSSVLFPSTLLVAACVGTPGDVQPGADDDLVAGPSYEGDKAVYNVTGPAPDLIESAVSDPPTTLVILESFTGTDTVTNQGTADAGATYTKYYLTGNGITPYYLVGNRPVGAIATGGSDTGSASLQIPRGVPAGTYRLLACADSSGGVSGRISQVDELEENNNCKASAGSVVVTGPDLIVSGVSSSPATLIAQTGTLTVFDTVFNVGAAAAGASQTRWYLSSDAVRSPDDAYIRNCTNGGPIPGRSVPGIAAGGNNPGSATAFPLCVRDNAGLHSPATGTYYVVSCADETAPGVPEINESNNCAGASNTLTITGYIDLIESAVTFTPGAVAAGDTLTITDTVQNVGGDPSGASNTKFYLSRSGTGGLQTYLGTSATATLPRAVPSLTANGTNTASTPLTIPDNLQNGNYTVYACADAGSTNASQQVSAVTEANENNNCTAAAGLLLASADLIISAISNPPATGTRSGNSSHFVVTATTSNIGTATAKASDNKYYLSTDGVTANYFLGVRQNVPSIPAGGSEITSTPNTGPVSQQITIDNSVPPGTYWLLGCADGGNSNTGNIGDKVREANELNNCLRSATQITVN